MDDVPVLDRARLALISRGNGVVANAFLIDLIDEAGGILARLDGLHTPENADDVADLAHTLKGMAAELGAERLRRYASELEREVRPEAWPHHIAKMHAALDELRRLVAQGEGYAAIRRDGAE